MRSTRFCLCLSLLVASAALDWAAAGGQSAPYPAADDQASPLAAQVHQSAATFRRGAPVAAEVAPAGPAASYALPLAAGDFLSVEFDCRGGRPSASIYGPDGLRLVEYSAREKGPTPASLIAESAGTYRLELSASEGAPPARCELKVAERRASGEADRDRVVAERAFDEAERLRREPHADARRRSIEKYKEAAALWRSAGVGREEAAALLAAGEAHELLSETDSAFAHYRQALAVSRRARDRRGAGEALYNIGHLHYFLGDPNHALTACVESLRLARAVGNRQGEARALSGIGEARYSLNDLPEAVKYLEQALTLWRALGDRKGEAYALVSAGYTYAKLSEIRQALEAYERALSLSREAKDARGEAITLAALATFRAKLGDKQEAFGFYVRAREIFREIGDRDSEASALAGVGYIYFSMGEARRGLEYYEQVLALFRAADDKWGEAEARMDMGRMYFSLGENEKALASLRDAHAIFSALKIPLPESQTLRDMGLVYGSVGDVEAALLHYRRALAILRRGPNRREEAYTLNYLGRAYEQAGDDRRAFEQYRRALPLARAAGDRVAEALTLYNTSHAHAARGDLPAARDRIEEAIRIVESLRTKVASRDMRSAYMASVRQYYDLYIDVLMRLDRARPGEGFVSAAFEASERARARTLLETLEENRAGALRGANPGLAEREGMLRRMLNAKAERRMQLLAARREAEAAAVGKEIDLLAAEYDEVNARIRASSPRYAALTQPLPLGPSDVQRRVLDDGTLLIEYALGEERSYMWVITRADVSGYELPPRREIEGAARAFYEALTAAHQQGGESPGERRARAARAEEQLATLGARLSDMVLAPASGHLGKGRLLIVPDGALQYVPFHALPAPAALGDGSAPGAPLIFRHEIVYEPSASALAMLLGETARREPAPNLVAVFADPVFEADDPRVRPPDRPGAQAGAKEEQRGELRSALRDVGASDTGGRITRLIASREEAHAITSLTSPGEALKAVDFDASRAAATIPELGRYRIVHFATHGLLDSDRPELSGLVLSLFDHEGRAQDGFLRIHDIYNLNLPADLVVLSACNTGLGKDMRGEGIVGLTRSFMYAGAGAVVASLWRVDDEATAELMRHFYEGMFRRGLAPPAALREAQLAMQGQRRWRSPYYWAGFVIQGQYAELKWQKDLKKPSPVRLTAWGGAAATLSFAALYFARLWRRRVRSRRAAAHS